MLYRLKGIFASFEKHEVRYVVIGGIAAILHGVPRMTFDLDILIDPAPENAAKLLRALLECGFGTAALITPDELVAREMVVFEDVERLDVQTKTPGIDFATAWANHWLIDYKDTAVRVVSVCARVASKSAAGRAGAREAGRHLGGHYVMPFPHARLQIQ